MAGAAAGRGNPQALRSDDPVGGHGAVAGLVEGRRRDAGDTADPRRPGIGCEAVVRSIGHHARVGESEPGRPAGRRAGRWPPAVGSTTPSGSRPPSSPISSSDRPAPSGFPGASQLAGELERFFADGAFDDPDRLATARAQLAQLQVGARRRAGPTSPTTTSSWPDQPTTRGAPVQQPGGEHAADRAAQMGLPADPGVAGEHAEDQPAVDQQHDHGDRHLTRPAGPQPARQQVGRASRRSGRWPPR